MKRTVLKFCNVDVVYGSGMYAARGINFEVAEGEILAIIGESGSGKTTIAHAALGLLPKNAAVTGSIVLNETEIVGAPEKTLRRLRGIIVGFVAQEPFSAFNPLMRVIDHVDEAWRVHAARPLKTLIHGLLENVGIKNAARTSQKYPHQWSGGMLQRATIVAASAHRPQLIIADEPTSALDAARADEILTLLRARGAAVVLISHNLKLTAKHASRIAVCYRGRLVEIDETKRILENPQHPYSIKLIESAFSKSDKTFRAPSFRQNPIVLEARKLTRVYGRGLGRVSAVADVDLKIHGGEIVGIHGASGCGKSTLLRLLAGIEKPSAGEVYYAGELAHSNQKNWPRKGRSGFVMPVFQDPTASLDSRWTIWRSITEPLTGGSFRRKRYSRAVRRQAARTALAEVELGEIDLEARPRELSIGQCQRVCIARALIGKPQLIIADEPTSALDAPTAAAVLPLLARIAEKGTAIVIVSHDRAALNSICHRVLQMRDGRLSA